MRLDPIVAKRFSELLTKGEAIDAVKFTNFTDMDGKRHMSIPGAAFKEWATSVLSLLQRTFGESSPHYKNFLEHYSSFNGWLSDYQDSLGIYKAALEDFNGGYMFNVRTLAKAEVLTDAIDQAKSLIESGYKDPACILARVALESALKDLAGKYSLPEGKLEKMNTELCKAGAFNMAKQKQITAWAEIGNKAAHGDWAAYSSADASAMVFGVESLIADL